MFFLILICHPLILLSCSQLKSYLEDVENVNKGEEIIRPKSFYLQIRLIVLEITQ